MNAKNICEALGGTWFGYSGLAFCPAHNNRNTPALSIRNAPNGTLLVYCFAGCQFKEILAGLHTGGILDGTDEQNARHHASVVDRKDTVVQRNSAYVRKIWGASRPIQGTLAHKYLASRGIGCALPDRACETAMWPEGTFQMAYANNVDAAVDDMIDTDEVAVALRDMMNRLGNWKGTSSELLASLKREIGEMGARSSDWPKSARGLSERVKRAETVLRKIGIQIRRRKEGRSRSRILVISNAAFRGDDPETFEQPSALSSSSAQIQKVSDPSEIRTEWLQTQPIQADATSKRSSKTARSKALKRNEMDDADGMEQCPCKQ